jgi:hypothetical protein
MDTITTIWPSGPILAAEPGDWPEHMQGTERVPKVVDSALV